MISSTESLANPYSEIVTRSRTIIRNIRSSRYFDAWDSFVHAWLQPLELSEDIEKLVGADVGTATDQLFERETTERGLQAIVNELNAMTYSQQASRFLDSLDQNSNLSLLVATKVLYAYLTLQRLSRLKPEQEQLSFQWSEKWHLYVDLQNENQRNQRQAEIRSEQLPNLFFESFETSVRDYVNSYQYTSTLLVTVLAAMPFTSKMSADFLYGSVAAILPMLPLYRLLADVTIEQGELINAGTYAYSCEHGLTLKEGYKALHSNTVEIENLRLRLRQQCATQIVQVKQSLEARFLHYPLST